MGSCDCQPQVPVKLEASMLTLYTGERGHKLIMESSSLHFPVIQLPCDVYKAIAQRQFLVYNKFQNTEKLVIKS